MEKTALTAISVLLTILQCVRTDLSAFWIADCDSVNRTKGCFRGPPGCTEFSEEFQYDGTSCSFFVTWQQTYDKKAVNFEVYAPADHELDYIAIAFSTNKRMAGSDVLACLSIDGKPQVTHSYNTVSHINEQRELIGVSRFTGLHADGILNCNFTRVKHIEGQSSFHNLNNDYYMLAARGRHSKGKPQIAYHGDSKFISETKFNFGTYTADPEPTTQSLTSDVTYRKTGQSGEGACSSSPCENSGDCFKTNDGFYCVCDDNYIGDRCEQDLTGGSAILSASALAVSATLMVYTLCL